MNRMFVNDLIIIKIEKRGRNCIFTLENSEEKTFGEIKKDKSFSIECTICHKKYKRGITKTYQKKPYKCSKCVSIYFNGFKGKKHTKEFKNKLSEQRTGIRLNPHSKSVYQWWLEKFGKQIADEKFKSFKKKLSLANSGKKNYFYKRQLTNEQKKKKQITLTKTLKNRTREEKLKISQKCSVIQNQIKNRNPKKYIEQKRKAGLVSSKSHKKYQMNKPEKILYNFLKQKYKKYNFKYSVILGHKQYDFGSKKHKVLIELHGDYWHGNPNIYKSNELNHIQIKNKQKDISKLEFAKKHNMNLIIIWEEDIKKQNFQPITKVLGEKDEV